MNCHRALPLVIVLGVFVTLSVALSAAGNAAQDDDKFFVPLFDGKTLDGWHGDEKLWKVEDGAIVGSTDGNIPHNTFLIYKKPYRNFVLKVRFKLEGGNSGVQFRSKESDEFIVSGYQADMAPGYWGLFYEERGRGILKEPDKEALEQAKVKPDEWNDYVITARGTEIKFELNGVTVNEYTETDSKIPDRGIIALQLHRGAPMKARFKDIKIKVVD